MNRTPQACRQCGRVIYFDGICIQCQAENERNEILAYSQQEIEAKIDEICADIVSSKALKEKAHIFKKLVNYRDINTGKIAKIAFQNHVFYPDVLYKDASDDIINAMMELLLNDDIGEHSADHILLCLASHGGEAVFHTFLELERNPREWRKKLYVNPSFYAAYGGWTFDENGKYIETQYACCYPMVKGTSEERQNSPVKIGTRSDTICKRCGGKIVNLIEVDGRDSRLHFLGIDGVIKAKFCPNCFIYDEGDFCRYTLDGESEIICDMDLPAEEDDLSDGDAMNNTYVLGREPVPLRYAADWEGGSSIGGFAFWIQDCEIKACPDCGKPMKYLAQVQWDTVLDGMEGNGYIEICTDCHVMAILHQQT